jgi:hypothetical protein
MLFSGSASSAQLAHRLAHLIASLLERHWRYPPLANQPQLPQPDYAAEYGPVLDAWVDALNTGNMDKVDAAPATDDKRTAVDQNLNGVEEAKKFVRQVRTAYPDFHIQSMKGTISRTGTSFSGVALARTPVRAVRRQQENR